MKLTRKITKPDGTIIEETYDFDIPNQEIIWNKDEMFKSDPINNTPTTIIPCNNYDPCKPPFKVTCQSNLTPGITNEYEF